MVNIGGTGTVVSGVNGIVSLNNNLYVAFSTFDVQWGFDQKANEVGGTAFPVMTTEKFTGSGSIKILWSTENTTAKEQFNALLQQAGGQVPAINMTVTGRDRSGAGIQFVWSGMVWPSTIKHAQSGTQAVTEELTFVLSSIPTMSSV
jgi:hypothetical protein